MTRSSIGRGAIAVTSAAAMLIGPAITVASASIPTQATRQHYAHCAITTTERTALLDARAALGAQLAGHHLTWAEKTALHAAIKELVTAARDAAMAPEVRAVKKAELAVLRLKLDAATTATERTAIRTEIEAIRLELIRARLTPAQRTAIAQQAKAMRSALRDRPSVAERRQIRAQIARITARLACRTVASTTS